MSEWSVESILNDLKSDIVDTFWELVGDLATFFSDLISAIPVPEFLEGLAPVIAQVPTSVLYWIEPFQLPYAFSVISAALAARLTLSLIPYIGSAFR